jgi:coenzyme F420 hydrogenase subunit beta
MKRMEAVGAVTTRPAEGDATAMKLLKLLSTVSRRRWPSGAHPAPVVGVPPPKKKADAAPAPAPASE